MTTASQSRVTILVTDDDPGHARLVEKNLARAGVTNPIKHFADGEEVLRFFFAPGARLEVRPDDRYLLLLDIRMPRVDGLEVLRRLKQDPELRKIPVLMLTTTDDSREIERCYAAGCNNYIVKPVDYERFAEAVQRLGLFINLVEVPGLGAAKAIQPPQD